LAQYDRYGSSQKPRRRGSILAPISFILIVAAIIFGMGVFFRVQTIEVYGAKTYSDEEIIEASGVEIGDNLFFINRFSASSLIFTKLPFIEEASIERIMPNQIVITVSESSAMAYIDWVGTKWMMTANCKMLGSGTDAELDGLIQVLNIDPAKDSDGSYKLEAGTILEVDTGERLKLTYLQELLHSFEALDMTRDVERLDLENPANPTFRYLDRFTVKMGPNDNTDYKLRLLLSAVTQMESDLTGVVDLSEGTAVHVSPD